MRRVVLALMVLGSVVGMGIPAEAQPVEEHCVMAVVDQATSGELILADANCYPTFKLAMKSEGVAAWGDGAAATAGEMAAAATFTIGTHYDLFNYGGSSTSVVGTTCGGGWLNTSSTWNNRISSTRNGCPSIRHYSGANLTGAFQTTSAPGGNLSALNNLTSSIQYNP